MSNLNPNGAERRPPATICRVKLTGFMGSGKSTIGRLLARALYWSHLDIDDQIEHTHGAPASVLFSRLGKQAFREAEAAIMTRCLKQRETVVSLGGAAVDLDMNREILAACKGSVIVFLDGEFEMLMAHCLLQEQSGSTTYRPLLHKKELAVSCFTTRREWNARLADLQIDVSNRTCETLAAMILEHLVTKAPSQPQLL